MQYLEDKFPRVSEKLVMDTPEDKAFVNLCVRVHDLYVASPNCTQPGFAHTQGAMYLAPYPTKHCAPDRIMDANTRSAKVAELFKQLTWLESNAKGPWLCGDQMTHADLTWFPTCIFMEFMLPRVFEWGNIFYETDVFPKITAWFALCLENAHFAGVRKQIYDHWTLKEEEGMFKAVKEDIDNNPQYKWKYM